MIKIIFEDNHLLVVEKPVKAKAEPKPKPAKPKAEKAKKSAEE